jgi:hypothetical protein
MESTKRLLELISEFRIKYKGIKSIIFLYTSNGLDIILKCSNIYTCLKSEIIDKNLIKHV